MMNSRNLGRHVRRAADWLKRKTRKAVKGKKMLSIARRSRTAKGEKRIEKHDEREAKVVRYATAEIGKLDLRKKEDQERALLIFLTSQRVLSMAHPNRTHDGLIGGFRNYRELVTQ